jgi:hypothetical protein
MDRMWCIAQQHESCCGSSHMWTPCCLPALRWCQVRGGGWQLSEGSHGSQLSPFMLLRVQPLLLLMTVCQGGWWYKGCHAQDAVLELTGSFMAQVAKHSILGGEGYSPITCLAGGRDERCIFNVRSTQPQDSWPQHGCLEQQPTAATVRCGCQHV